MIKTVIIITVVVAAAIVTIIILLVCFCNTVLEFLFHSAWLIF